MNKEKALKNQGLEFREDIMVYRGKERLRGLLKREGITDAEK